jgi:23S rRNA (cytidine1920-2'-O)/16S rRNA (cytidine1409-2'-O)-methyltransferase
VTIEFAALTEPPMTERTKTRLDQLLTLRGLAATRSRARDLIKRGLVTVGGRVETRAGLDLPLDAAVAVTEEWSGYVSRGALKLIAALDAFGFKCEGRATLDIGASTGGFTQVLLMRGSRRVYAADVGSGQLHPSLAADPRVINLENTDARRLDRDAVPKPVEAITADVSFISLAKALPAALALAAPGAWAVALVKPQFEAGPEHVGKGGIVKSEEARAAALQSVIDFMSAQAGWRVEGAIPSPVAGQSGNLEYLIGARHAP